MSKVLITETVLRDAHQSLAATRMTTNEMLPILDEMDKVGYYSLEAWGGATFDSCLRFLNEDPWERLRAIKNHCKNTKLQMLFRGQNILGYRHYADDVVEYFVQKSIANGIDIIRIFDALNDARNLETAIKATIKEGGHVQAAISYTTSPFHTNEGFAQYAKQLEEMGAHSICIKDMSGLLKPYEAYQLVKTIKNSVKIPVHNVQFQAVKKLILQCVEMKFVCCSENKSESHTVYIKEGLKRWNTDEAVLPLMKKIVDAISLEKDGSITITLINQTKIIGGNKNASSNTID